MSKEMTRTYQAAKELRTALDDYSNVLAMAGDSNVKGWELMAAKASGMVAARAETLLQILFLENLTL